MWVLEQVAHYVPIGMLVVNKTTQNRDDVSFKAIYIFESDIWDILYIYSKV